MLVTHLRGGRSSADFPARVGVDRRGQTISVNGQLVGLSRQSHEHDDVSVELVGRAAPARANGQQSDAVQSRIPSAAPGSTQQMHTVGLFRDSDERHDLSLEDLIGRFPKSHRQIVPGQQRFRPFRDSDERHDLSIEDLVGRRQNVQSRKSPIQQGAGHVFVDSDENDVSDEVNLSLLPELLRLLQPDVRNGAPVVIAGQPIDRPRYDENPRAYPLEFDDILSNPTFQQRIQEIDERLKRAPAARGKRLMEKYATALAVYSSPSNTASPSSMTSSHLLLLLPLFIACFRLWLS